VGGAGGAGAAGTAGAAGKGQGGAIYDASHHHIQGLGSDTFSGNSASTSDNDVFQKGRGDDDDSGGDLAAVKTPGQGQGDISGSLLDDFSGPERPSLMGHRA
jgi:hypothetical protein